MRSLGRRLPSGGSWRLLLIGFVLGAMFVLFVSGWQRTLRLADDDRSFAAAICRERAVASAARSAVQQHDEVNPLREAEGPIVETVVDEVSATEPPPSPTTAAPVIPSEPLQHDFTKHVYQKLQQARASGVNPATVIPVVVTPTFHDGEELKRMLLSLNVPVRYFVFVWNSRDGNLDEIFRDLKRIPIPGAITIHHNPDNFGFAASINHGMRFGLSRPQSEVPWYFVINCDVSFPESTLPQMVANAHAADPAKISMMYGPGIDHYAFIVTRRAVEIAGLMDENFYPAYFEDVDWRWRMNLAGFEELVMHLPVNHIRSVNLRRGDGNFHAQHHRHGNGWPYGGMKWGEVNQNRIHDRYPPSGWKNPFGINMSLDMWVIDPERLECIKHGKSGPTHPGTGGHCWYNGYKVLSPVLPAGTWFPECMKKPYPDAFKPR